MQGRAWVCSISTLGRSSACVPRHKRRSLFLYTRRSESNLHFTLVCHFSSNTLLLNGRKAALLMQSSVHLRTLSWFWMLVDLALVSFVLTAFCSVCGLASFVCIMPKARSSYLPAANRCVDAKFEVLGGKPFNSAWWQAFQFKIVKAVKVQVYKPGNSSCTSIF